MASQESREARSESFENQITEQSQIEFQISDDKSNDVFFSENTEKSDNVAERVIEPDLKISDETQVEIFSNDFEQAAEEKSQESREARSESENANSFTEQTKGNGQRTTDEFPPLNSAEKVVTEIDVENLSSAKIRPIAQLHNSYIIAVDDEGMLLIDQHVAHERILFDKFRRKENERRIESQNLLLPETFDLTPAQAVAFDLVADELENVGFALMRLSGRTIAVKAVPTDLPPSEVRNLLAEILDSLDSVKRGNARETLRDDIAASLACKAAVKVNMKLTPEKMQWLVDKLLLTSSPTTCPHGRPVILRLTMKDIERGFHRT